MNCPWDTPSLRGPSKAPVAPSSEATIWFQGQQPHVHVFLPVQAGAMAMRTHWVLVSAGFTILALTAVMSGCVTKSTTENPLALVGSESPQRCPVAGQVLLDEHVSVQNGGAGGQAFELPAWCDLDMDYAIQTQAGHLDFTVSGPGYTPVAYDRDTVTTSGVNMMILVGATGSENFKSLSPAPPGTYRFSYEASLVAEFVMKVTAHDV